MARWRDGDGGAGRGRAVRNQTSAVQHTHTIKTGRSVSGAAKPRSSSANAPSAPMFEWRRNSCTTYFTHVQLSGGRSSSWSRMITSPRAMDATRLYPCTSCKLLLPTVVTKDPARWVVCGCCVVGAQRGRWIVAQSSKLSPLRVRYMFRTVLVLRHDLVEQIPVALPNRIEHTAAQIHAPPRRPCTAVQGVPTHTERRWPGCCWRSTPAPAERSEASEARAVRAPCCRRAR